MTFISIASGSDGNCYYIEHGEYAILIDAGVGVRTIKKRLAEYNKKIESVKMVLVTHDHIDHIKHLGSLAERYNIPVISSERVHQSLSYHKCTVGRLTSARKVIEKNREYTIGPISVTAFDVPHDGRDNMGFSIGAGGENIVFITDAGSVTDLMKIHCKSAKHLIIESNYDNEMLLNGSYSPELIDRIKNGNGHLSNDQTAEALKEIWHPGLRSISLCHLSSNNNTPEKAYRASFDALHDIGVKPGVDIELNCLPRRSPFFFEL